MPDAQDIDEVVAELDDIIAAAIANQRRLGLFAALYRQVTLRVRQGIADNFFDDGPRMARLDTVFANRYLTALATWDAGGAPSKCWQFAFDASRRADLIIVQHLLLGINAHINLDLGIAAATVCPGAQLPGLHADFDRINQILSALTDGVKRVVARFSPMIHLLDELGGTVEDEIINFSMTRARDDAWQHAELLAAQPAAQQAATIAMIDSKATFLARLVAEPGRLITLALDAIHLGERQDLPAIIEAINTIVG
jgi:uncharacterized protein DUF5995